MYELFECSVSLLRVDPLFLWQGGLTSHPHLSEGLQFLQEDLELLWIAGLVHHPMWEHQCLPRDLHLPLVGPQCQPKGPELPPPSRYHQSHSPLHLDSPPVDPVCLQPMGPPCLPLLYILAGDSSPSPPPPQWAGCWLLDWDASPLAHLMTCCCCCWPVPEAAPLHQGWRLLSGGLWKSRSLSGLSMQDSHN